MKWVRGVLMVALMLGSMPMGWAAAIGGGGGGGGGGGDPSLRCVVQCHLRFGSCTIPSGDPGIPALKDPFCAAQKAACLAACPSAGGGGGFIGLQAPAHDFLMSPVAAPVCSARSIVAQG